MMAPTPANVIAIYSFVGQFHFSLASDESSLPYAQALQIKERATATLLACFKEGGDACSDTRRRIIGACRGVMKVRGACI
jgi:hypothetical protein